jgi:hypothetical protein
MACSSSRSPASGRSAVGGLEHDVAVHLQVEPHGVAQVRFVVDEQDPGSHEPLLALSSPPLAVI